MSTIRPKVVCILRRGASILLIRATDPEDDQSFLTPPGGGVKFGETLEQAMCRELHEELGVDLSNFKRLGMLENFFRLGGRDEHELVYVFETDAAATALAQRDELEVIESNGERLPARWYGEGEIAASGLPVYPTGVLDLVRLEA
jgi:8-oxo-dGTP pyrophosphatase MutT (NUDIX family)